MSEEPEGTGSEFPVAATSEPEDLRTAAPEPATPGVRRRGGALALLVALLALAVAGYALWREMTRERIGASAASAVRASLGDRLDQLAATQAKLNRDLATQRARMNDADSVNNSVHEELLSLTDRSRHLEDAIGNLAEQRLSGRDAMASNEAEFLLQLGAERLALFHDASTALAAYRLADSALASAEDPVFASVRQTIDAEIQLLMQAKPLQTQATLDALERVRAMLRDLPLKAHAVAAPVAADQSRLMQLLHQFVRIGHEPAVATDQRDAVLARDFATIDLRAAEAALLARDPQAWNAALGRVRAELLVRIRSGLRQGRHGAGRSRPTCSHPVVARVAGARQRAQGTAQPARNACAVARCSDLAAARRHRRAQAARDRHSLSRRPWQRIRPVRIWIAILLLLAVAVAAAFGWHWLAADPGYVLVRLRGSRSKPASLSRCSSARRLGLLSLLWRLARWPSNALRRAAHSRGRDRLAAGVTAFAEGRYAQAETDLAKAARHEPVRAPALLAQAYAARARGASARADEILIAAAEHSSPAALASRAQFFIDDGQSAQALELLKPAAASGTLAPRGWRMLIEPHSSQATNEAAVGALAPLARSQMLGPDAQHALEARCFRGIGGRRRRRCPRSALELVERSQRRQPRLVQALCPACERAGSIERGNGRHRSRAAARFQRRSRSRLRQARARPVGGTHAQGRGLARAGAQQCAAAGCARAMCRDQSLWISAEKYLRRALGVDESAAAWDSSAIVATARAKTLPRAFATPTRCVRQGSRRPRPYRISAKTRPSIPMRWCSRTRRPRCAAPFGMSLTGTGSRGTAQEKEIRTRQERIFPRELT